MASLSLEIEKYQPPVDFKITTTYRLNVVFLSIHESLQCFSGFFFNLVLFFIVRWIFLRMMNKRGVFD